MSDQRPTGYLQSARTDIAKLSRKDGQGWLLHLYVFLLALFPLAQEPADQELPSDLYVMF